MGGGIIAPNGFTLQAKKGRAMVISFLRNTCLFSFCELFSKPMPLISIWKSNPETVSQMSIEQIVATAGNGKLLDNSDCSSELREYLSQVSSEKLAEYADHCLTSKYDAGGKVLQDVVNEFGRR